MYTKAPPTVEILLPSDRIVWRKKKEAPLSVDDKQAIRFSILDDHFIFGVSPNIAKTIKFISITGNYISSTFFGKAES